MLLKLNKLATKTTKKEGGGYLISQKSDVENVWNLSDFILKEGITGFNCWKLKNCHRFFH